MYNGTLINAILHGFFYDAENYFGISVFLLRFVVVPNGGPVLDDKSAITRNQVEPVTVDICRLRAPRCDS